MHYYKTIIQYEGTNYFGFQWQDGIQTVQKEFNNALSKLLDVKFTTMAASRTDTGVHAIEQVVKISSSNPINVSLFLEAFNKVLPRDIRCVSITSCSGLFRPAIEAESKEYRYFFTNKNQVSKDDSRFIANISNPLDLEAMQTCIRSLIGTHDFCNFYSSGSNVKSTIRNVLICDLAVINPHDFFSDLELFKIPNDLQSCYEFRIIAKGFLKQMIRHIVSALWMVGSGRMSPSDFIALLNGPKNAQHSWKVATPNGLFLYQIKY